MFKESSLDKIEIREVIETFFFAMDEKDTDLLSSILHNNFTIEITLSSPMRITGRSKWLSTYRKLRQTMSVSSHSISNCHIKITGDSASSTSNVVAYVKQTSEEKDVMRVRGIRYEDEFVRFEGRWLMTERRHLPVWQLEANTVPLGLDVSAERSTSETLLPDAES